MAFITTSLEGTINLKAPEGFRKGIFILNNNDYQNNDPFCCLAV